MRTPTGCFRFSRARASCTRPSGWWQAADRGLASECAVAAFSVVVLEPGCKGGSPVVVAGECLPVGPFGGEGAVESFDLAVLPGAVGLDELLLDTVSGTHCSS